MSVTPNGIQETKNDCVVVDVEKNEFSLPKITMFEKVDKKIEELLNRTCTEFDFTEFNHYFIPFVLRGELIKALKAHFESPLPSQIMSLNLTNLDGFLEDKWLCGRLGTIIDLLEQMSRKNSFSGLKVLILDQNRIGIKRNTFWKEIDGVMERRRWVAHYNQAQRYYAKTHQALKDILKNNPSLEELSLCNNELNESYHEDGDKSEKGLAALVEGLQHCHHLKELNLTSAGLQSCYVVGNNPLKNLPKALAKMPELRSLKIKGNVFLCTTAHAKIMDSLRKHSQITELSLGHSWYQKPEGIAALKLLLQQTNTLQSLSLPVHSVLDPIWDKWDNKDLMELFYANRSLARIHFPGNWCSLAHLQGLVLALQNHPRLIEVQMETRGHNPVENDLMGAMLANFKQQLAERQALIQRTQLHPAIADRQALIHRTKLHPILRDELTKIGFVEPLIDLCLDYIAPFSRPNISSLKGRKEGEKEANKEGDKSKETTLSLLRFSPQSQGVSGFNGPKQDKGDKAAGLKSRSS